MTGRPPPTKKMTTTAKPGPVSHALSCCGKIPGGPGRRRIGDRCSRPSPSAKNGHAGSTTAVRRSLVTVDSRIAGRKGWGGRRRRCPKAKPRGDCRRRRSTRALPGHTCGGARGRGAREGDEGRPDRDALARCGATTRGVGYLVSGCTS
jgi:hypothetical protein